MNAPLALPISACFDCTSRLILPPSLPAAQVLRFARSSPPPRYQAAVCACVCSAADDTDTGDCVCVLYGADCDCGRLGSRLLNSPLAVCYILYKHTHTHTHTHHSQDPVLVRMMRMQMRKTPRNAASRGAHERAFEGRCAIPSTRPSFGGSKMPQKFRCARLKLQTPQKPPPLPKNRA
jgi:hypothetical protein